ncbi:protein DA1-related 1-like [Tasmannia lanceolata]|uniref:protein DA1-related 1-like n=1 Tax=Tasmannia lanceolata TaxID=3420 RepID=UPI004062DB26
MDRGECHPLYIEIQEYFEGLNMKVEQQVPLLLVERQALNKAVEGEKNGHNQLGETVGFCMSEILKRPKIGSGNRIGKIKTEPYRLTRRRDVTAILVLYEFPRLKIRSILAHELMHAWMNLNGTKF